MGARGMLSAVVLLLAFSALAAAAPQSLPIGDYVATLSFNPDPPLAGKPVDIRLSFRNASTNATEENFTAKVEIRRGDALTYTLEGTYPTSDLLIPYRFTEDGAYRMVVEIPRGDDVERGMLPFTVGAPKAKGLGGLPAWLRVLLLMLLIAAFWRFRWPRRPQKR